ncbi:MAG TPA: bifunctional oligoribonuclease/PAP phosphatase NrnA [Planctomycetota bacterium]|nr:bifunctional oligoribonuclease/PAP phosphatase NrnA [Planctomycetota bacterium]
MPALRSPDYDRVANLLRERDRFLITGHVRADGDCLGAEAALWHLLRALGKEATIVNPDPIAARYAFLADDTPFGHFDPRRSDGGIPDVDVACVMDVAVLERTAAVGEVIVKRAAARCVFDHHEMGPGTVWDHELIDSTAPSTGALVLRLARRMSIALPKPALEAVFVSIASDTGWFRYSNADRESFEVAASVVGAGVDPSSLYGRLYQTYPPEWPIGVGLALRSVRYEAGGRLAVAAVRREELASAGGELSDTDEVLDILRAVGKVEVVLLFRESEPGRAKCSARSKGSFDVNALLRPFGGGGHKRAAGADLPGPFDAAVSKVVAAAVSSLESERVTPRGSA